MQDQPTPHGLDQAAIERAVLILSLAAYPKPLPLAQIAAEIGDAKAAEDAVGKLCRVGLLDHQGGSAAATPAAQHFDQLGL